MSMRFPVSFAALAAFSLAVPDGLATPRASEAVSPRDPWFDASPAHIYTNPDNPYVQSLRLTGRAHYQVASVSGKDTNGYKFDEEHDELRRLRLGAKARVLGFVSASFEADLVDDRRYRAGAPSDIFLPRERGEMDWGFVGVNEAVLKFDLYKTAGADVLRGLRVGAGKTKLRVGFENSESSDRLMTVERSDLAAKLDGQDGRPVGVWAEWGRKRWALEAGVFAGADEKDVRGDWSGGCVGMAGLRWRAAKPLWLHLQHVHAEPRAENQVTGYEWVNVAGAEYDAGIWGCAAEVALGDNGGEVKSERQGAFGGVLFRPWVWVVPKKVRLVARAQHMQAEKEEGLRLGPRYLRDGFDDGLVDVNRGRGDELNSLYAGGSYHFRGDLVQVLAGVSFDRLAAPDGKVSGRTWIAACRFSF